MFTWSHRSNRRGLSDICTLSLKHSRKHLMLGEEGGVPAVNRQTQAVVVLYRTLSQGGSCGLGLAGTDGRGSSGVLRHPSAPRTTSASLTVTVELQTEPASSASPPTAEWWLWLELLKPLTLSPDDSELSTAANPRRNSQTPPEASKQVLGFSVHTHIISCEPPRLGPGRLPPELQEVIRILPYLLRPPSSWARTGTPRGTETRFQRMKRKKNCFPSQETWAGLREARLLNLRVTILQSRAPCCLGE